jgi:hypothetical protein
VDGLGLAGEVAHVLEPAVVAARGARQVGVIYKLVAELRAERRRAGARVAGVRRDLLRGGQRDDAQAAAGDGWREGVRCGLDCAAEGRGQEEVDLLLYMSLDITAQLPGTTLLLSCDDGVE